LIHEKKISARLAKYEQSLSDYVSSVSVQQNAVTRNSGEHRGVVSRQFGKQRMVVVNLNRIHNRVLEPLAELSLVLLLRRRQSNKTTLLRS
jgi:hypothetical protein